MSWTGLRGLRPRQEKKVLQLVRWGNWEKINTKYDYSKNEIPRPFQTQKGGGKDVGLLVGRSLLYTYLSKVHAPKGDLGE